ncbi:MAG: class I SAM-dependent methyltransferase [Phycisphaerae bacterium]
MKTSVQFGPSADLDKARAIVAKFNSGAGGYHRLDFGNGLVLNGNYDMAKHLAYYHLPERLDGMRVLDVGSASGFFSFETLRRGASVTAIDVFPETCLLTHLAKAFDLNVRYVTKSVYDLTASFGQFDLVICGSLLLHLADPLGALRALRQVTSGRLVVSTSPTPDSATNPAPVCHFVGQKAVEGDYWCYWLLSAAALTRMLSAAGFTRVDNIEHFVLTPEPGRPPFVKPHPHVAMSAYV